MEVPGNLVYFKVLKDDPGELILRAVGGDVIPSSIRMIGKDRVFAPNDPVAPDTVVQLDYTLECNYAGFGPPERTFFFKTVQLSEVKVHEGVLQVEAIGLEYPDAHSNDTGFVQLRYYDSVEFGGHHLIDRTVTIDAMRAAIDLEGRIKVSSPCNLAVVQPSVDTCGTLRSVPIGEHTIEVRASIVGQTSDPPLTRITVRTACSIGCPTVVAAQACSGVAGGQSAEPELDAGAEPAADNAGAESMPSSAQPAKAEVRLPENAPPAAAQGCTVRLGARSSGTATLWLLVFALGAWRSSRARVPRRRLGQEQPSARDDSGYAVRNKNLI